MDNLRILVGDEGFLGGKFYEKNDTSFYTYLYCCGLYETFEEDYLREFVNTYSYFTDVWLTKYHGKLNTCNCQAIAINLAKYLLNYNDGAIQPEDFDKESWKRFSDSLLSKLK